ncbi:MAG: response regulator [bacterium]|nr:response regulator [bacterium]
MRCRILIVDDILENRKLLAGIIRKHTGHEVFLAKSGLDVVEMLKDPEMTKPDLILLDVMMPDMDGFEVAKILKSDSLTRDIPIIFITGLSDTDCKIQGFEVGGADYLSKPFNKQELLARVNTHLKLKQNEDSLRKKNIALNALIQKKNMLLGIAAHDLRNPLMTISGLADLFVMKYDKELKEDQRKFLHNITKLANFMNTIVDDFLDYSAIESGKLNLNLKETNVAKLIQNNIEYNKSLAERKQIALDFYYGDNLPEDIMLDAHKIKQVMNNLITNAIKFSHSNTTIEVHLKLEDQNLLFFVRDQGQGIPKEELEILFTPFQKTSVKSTAGEKSTGLGLAIVKKIVMGHKGKIWVESEIDKGSTFYVSIPL